MTMTDCWLWDGPTSVAGYGRTGGQSKDLVHRHAYEVAFDCEIPPGTEIDHLCRIRSCFNPDHLEAVSHEENQRRGAKVALKTHCAQGHPWVPENIYTHPNIPATAHQKVQQDCLICRRERSRRASSGR